MDSTPAIDRSAHRTASSHDAWLDLEISGLPHLAGRFVEITYRVSYWDEPLRPIFRFETKDGAMIDDIGAGPFAGAGLWIGRVPLKSIRLSVNISQSPGPFSFVVERIRKRSWLALLAYGFRQRPRRARSAFLTKLIGWHPESDRNLQWAIRSTDFVDYSAWLAKHHRSLDLKGIDTPRFDWTKSDPLHLVIDARDSSQGLETTLDSLRTQVFTGWTLLILTREDVTHENLMPPADERVRLSDKAGDLANVTGLVGSMSLGCQLPNYSLAAVLNAAHRHPEALVFFGDDEYRHEDGSISPALKPNWSGLHQEQPNRMGHLVFVRAPSTAWTNEDYEAFASGAQLPASSVKGLRNDEVKHIRRVLQRIERPPPLIDQPIALPSCGPAAVAIIIPTRDKASLLKSAIDSIYRHADPKRFRILIVDNESVEKETKDLFETFRDKDNISICPFHGAFNFSAMCNMAASSTDAEVLLFLNNDIEILTPMWLDRLTAWALRDDIGAVGVKMTYPSGSLQHIGVVLGLGGLAGHFGSHADADSPGWMGRNKAVHAVSAVTGACLAVAREKFEAVGGFDAIGLPIDLNDIDLCLKLGARGWQSVVDPAVHLIHLESASRGGATFRRLDKYQVERDVFLSRWLSVIRDDPYFHPGLSLYDWEPALG